MQTARLRNIRLVFLRRDFINPQRSVSRQGLPFVSIRCLLKMLSIGPERIDHTASALRLATVTSKSDAHALTFSCIHALMETAPALRNVLATGKRVRHSW